MITQKICNLNSDFIFFGARFVACFVVEQIPYFFWLNAQRIHDSRYEQIILFKNEKNKNKLICSV